MRSELTFQELRAQSVLSFQLRALILPCALCNAHGGACHRAHHLLRHRGHPAAPRRSWIYTYLIMYVCILYDILYVYTSGIVYIQAYITTTAGVVLLLFAILVHIRGTFSSGAALNE